MRIIQAVLVVLLCSPAARAQEGGLFKTAVVNAKRSDRKSVRDFTRATTAFYEDTSFTVSKSCFG